MNTKQRSKVPEATLLFWTLKVLTTGMGETTSDFFARLVDPVLAVGLTGLALALGLAWQLTRPRLVLALYWLNVALVSVFGTMAADVLHVGLGVPYEVSTALFTLALLAVFGLWYLWEKSLSIENISSLRREILYWLTVLTTFALGTAAGDWTAVSLGWGYAGAGVLFGLAFLVPWALFLNGRWAPVATFWLAYILTRPLGASWADWAGVSRARGGLEWGTGTVSLALFVVFIALVVLARAIARRSRRAERS